MERSAVRWRCALPMITRSNPVANYRNDYTTSRRNTRRTWQDDDRGGRFDRGGYRSDRDDWDRNRSTSRLIASDRVEGTAVYDRRGNRLGTIENFMVGKRSGRVEYAVLSFGGFLGMGQQHYPLPWDQLDYDESMNGYVVDITEDDLDRAPSHRAGDEIDYERGYGADVRGYYGGY